MAAVISGEGLGLYNSSLNTLGAGLGQGAQLGRQGNHVYVNVSTGNLVVRQRDEFLSGTGLDLNLTRTYNSLGILDGDNNDNWRLNVYRRLGFTGTANTAGSTITKTNSDGSQSLYQYDTGLGYYVSTDGDGAHDTIKQQGGNWVWSAGDSTVTETYNSAGQLLSVQDSDGHARSYVYTGSLITQINDSSGQTVNLVYSGNNLQRIETISGGVTQTRVHYSYDVSNRLETVSVDLSPEDNAIADGNVFATTYTYDGTSNRIASIAHSDGSVVSFAYDTSNRISTVTRGSGADAKITRYEYNQVTQQQLDYGASNATSVVDPLGYISTYVFDGEGKLLETLSPALSAGQRLSTRYQYDAQDNVSRVVDGRGHAVDYLYSDDGALLRQQDAAGNVVEYGYTDANLLQNRTVYLTPDPDGVGSIQASDPQTTRNVYDAEGHLRFIISADGSVLENRYDAAGNLIATLSYAQDVFDTSGLAVADALDLAQLESWAANPARDLTALERTDFAYDFRGNLASTTRYAATLATGLGDATTASVTHYIYDQSGQLIKTIDPRGIANNNTAFVANNFETHYVYDGLGRVTQTTDALGNQTSTIYNDVGQRIETTLANGLIRTTIYDAQGQIVSLSELDPANLATPLSETRSVYDDNGRLRAVQNANGVIEHTLYDAAGRLVATVDATGALIENIYNENNQLIRQIAYATVLDAVTLAGLVNLNIEGALLSANTVSLDALRPVSHADDRSTYNFYDEAGRLAFEIDAEAYVTEYVYDGAGQVTDTIRHNTPFPGLINNADATAQITVTDTNTLIEWVNGTVPANSQISTTIIEEETGNAINVDLTVNTDATTGTVTASGTVNTTTVPQQAYDSDNFASTDTRTLVSNAEAVSNQHLTVEISPSGYAVNRTTAYQTTESTLNISVNNHTTYNSSNVSRSGSNTTVTGVAYNFTPVNIWTTQLQINNGSWSNTSGAPSYTGTPDPITFANLSPGQYRMRTQHLSPPPYNYGGPVHSGVWSSWTYFTIGQVQGSSISVTQPAGASSIDFYHRPASATGSGGYTLDNQHGFSIDIGSGYNGQTRDFKVLYRNSANAIIGIGVGQFTVNQGGSSANSFTYYDLQTTASGTYIENVLSSAEVGDLGDELGTTLGYVDVSVYAAGTNTLVSTARTYPNVVKGITGSSPVNLSMNAALADGFYDIVINKFYPNGSAAGTQTIANHQIGIATAHVQELAWSANVQPLSNSDQAVFYYRPQNAANPEAYTALALAGSSDGLQTYFVQEGGQYKVRLYDLDPALNYEYYVEYRAADQRLLKWTGTGDNPHALSVTSTANTPTNFSHYDTASTANTGGTRLVGVFSAEEIQLIDYVSVDVVDTVTNSVVHNDVLTIPREESNYLGSLNLTTAAELADGRYRIEVTRYFKDESQPAQFDYFIHEVGMQAAHSLVHSNAIDNLATVDTHNTITDYAAVSNTGSVEVTPPSHTLDRSRAYDTTQHTGLNLSASPRRTSHSSNVSRSGSTTTVSGINYNPNTIMSTWRLFLYKKNSSGSWVQQGNSYSTFSAPSSYSFSNLGPGNYLIETEHFIPPPYNYGGPVPSGSYRSTTFRVGGALLGTRVNVPTIPGATSIDFRHRASSGTGAGGYTLDNEHDFNIDLASSFNNQWRDYRIDYKNSSGSVIAVATGSFYANTSGTRNHSATAYQTNVTSSGTTISGVLSGSEVGNVGDELSTTLSYVDATVYLAGTTTVVSSARTYPNVAKLTHGINDGRINLSMDSALADGFYDIVIDKHYTGGASSLAAQTLSNVQVGNVYTYIQELSWPALTPGLLGSDSATFYYRKAGDAAYSQLALSATASGNSYFIQDGADYKVRLYDLAAASNYEYYVEYRDTAGEILKQAGSAYSPLTIHSEGDSNQSAAFTHVVVGSSSQAGDNGTRLSNYLTPVEAAATDYLSVDVIDDVSGQAIYTDVLTVPRAQLNYDGGLNLSPRMELLPGRYRIEVTRYFNDEALAPQLSNFIHEVSSSIDSGQPLTVQVVGNQITASYAGDLLAANGLSLVVDTENNTIALDLQQPAEGPFSYTQRVTDTADASYSEDSSRFAVFSGATPDIAALRDFYSRDRRVSVDVSQTQYIHQREPELPSGYTLVTSSQGTTTAQQNTPVAVSAASATVDSGNVVNGQYIDISNITLNRPTTTGYDKRGAYVWEHFEVIDRETGRVVYEAPEPSLHSRGVTAPNTEGHLRQEPTPTTFDVTRFSTGRYRLVIRPVKVSRTVITVPSHLQGVYNHVGPTALYGAPGVTYTEYYAWESATTINFNIDLPSTTTVSWPLSSQPTDTTVRFKYAPAGFSPNQVVSVIAQNGQLTAQIGNDNAGLYNYSIEYVNGAGEVVKSSTGQFEIVLNQQTTTNNQFVEDVVVAGDVINGSSLISAAHNRTDIESIEARVYDAASGLLVSGPEMTYPQLITGYAGQINLQSGTQLANGRYRVELVIDYVGAQPPVTETPFFIEIGRQDEQKPATEISWDATNRPRNTDVYFRYKAVADAEYDPQNLWIRATASQTIQGQYYVRFPQMTPDGQLLDPLAVGAYDYMVIYVDRDTGKEVESAQGGFSVVHENGRVDAHQLSFGRELDGRQDRLFYNDRGQVIATLNALGYLSENIYDAAGRLVETIRYATQSIESDWQQGSLDRLRPAANAEDLHSYKRYDAQGRLGLEVNAERYVTEYIYGVDGNVAEVISYANRTTAADPSSASIAELRPLTSTEDRAVLNAYTALGQIESITQRIGSTNMSIVEYEYDTMGQVLKTINRDLLSPADERAASNRYDLQGRVIATLNGEGNQALADLLAANPAASQAEIDAVWAQYGVNYEYDAAGQQTRVTDQNNHRSHFYYDTRGNIRYSVNALGEVEEVIYNSFGQVSHTVQYANRVDAAQLAGLAGGLLTQEIRNTFNVLRDPENDSVIEQAYDHRGLVINRQDALGNNTRFEYNAFAELRFERQTLKGGATDGVEYRVEHIYDALGRETNVIAGANGNDINQGFDYDAFGRVTASYNYDSNNRIYNHYTNSYDRLGRVTETLEVVDSATPVLRSINGYTYDAFDRQLTQTDASGSVMTYSYDDVNRSLTVITPEGISTTTKTNAWGETVELTNGEGQITRFEYDKNGQLLTTTDAENNITRSEYDAAGRLIREIDANGVAVRIEYDAANRVTKRIVDPTITDTIGNVVYQGLNLETSFTYDAKGQVLSTTDPNGVVTETRYDNKGQVVSIIVDPDLLVDDGLDHLALATFYSYDSRGNRLTVNVGREPGIVDTTDSAGNPAQEYIKAINSTQYDYDLHGRLMREVIDPTITWTDANDVEHVITGINAETLYEYDAQNNLAVQTNARGFSTHYVHDAFGRLIYSFVESGNDQGLVTENIYNADDQLIRVIQYSQSVSLAGVSGVITLQEAQALTSGLSSAQDRTQQRVFDGDNRLIYTISPTGLVSENVYDNNGRIAQVIAYSQAIVAGDYNSVAQVQSALTAAADAEAEQQAWSVYDGTGLALYNIDSLGYVTANSFDANGNLLRSVQYATAIDTTILNDATDNRAQLDALMPTLANVQHDRVLRYAYDAGNRLVYQLDAMGYVTESRYDDMGRVIAHIAYADALVVASAEININQIAGLLPAEPGITDSVTLTAYDAVGQIAATRDAEGGEEFFQYDLAGNRIAYTNANGHTWHYDYDAANRMVEQRSPEVSVTRLDATIWQQQFEADLSGVAGSLTASAANYSLADQRLSLIHSGSGSHELAGTESYQYDRHLRFETTVTTGVDVSTLELMVGAENAAGTAQHGLLISGGRLYAQYDNGNPVDLGAAQANTTYIVELETSADNSTLWVYEAGQAREQGLSDVRASSSWINNGNNIHWQARFTSNATASGEAAHIDNVRVLMPRERALMDEGVSLSSQTSLESIVTRIEYNAMGDVTARIEAAGTSDQRRTEYVYDALNRQVSVVHPEVGVYNYADQATSYVGSRQETQQNLSSHVYYDALGNEVLGIDTAGNRSYKVYDGNGRLVYDIDANGHVTENRYDAFGNITELVRYANAITLPTGAIDASNPGLSITDLTGSASPYALAPSSADRVFVTEYDLSNRATRIIEPTVSVAALDAAGNATVSSAAPTTANEYNAFGQLVKQSKLASGGVWLEAYFYYDSNGNRIASVDAEGYMTQLEYDDAGNVTRQIEYANALDLVTTPINTSTVPTPVVDVGGNDRETTYTYDGLSRKLTETQVAVSYSQASATGAGTNSYDATFTQATANLTTAYEYDAVGNVVATTDVGGNVTYQFYDAMGRITGETSVSRSQQQLGINLDTTLFVDEVGTANATLRWARPPIPGLTAELRVRAVGATSWTTLVVVEKTNTLEAVIGALPSDQYEYELDYRRVGQAAVYASASGQVNVVTNRSTGSLGLAYQVQSDGDTLIISGNTAGLTGVLIGSTSYAATSIGNGRYSINLSGLARGNYEFTTQGAATIISGQVQKITGALGGEFAIQTTNVDIQYDVVKQAKYVVTGNNKGYWRSNRLEVSLPSLEHLGMAHMQYEIVVEFSNANGDTKERTYTGNVTGQQIVIATSDRLNATRGYRYHGRMEDVVSIKLWRGDADTLSYFERPNFVAISNPGRYGGYYFPIIEKTYGHRDLVLEATGGMDTQQLEFINLPDGSSPGEAESRTAEFSYRLQGSDDTWVRKQLNRVGQGYFSIGNRDIPAGVYEYQIRINGSNQVIQSGQNLVIGNGISGYESISQASATGDGAQTINTPLTSYKRDAFGNSVQTTLYANSAVFDSDGNVSVLEDAARDENIYTYFDSHGRMVQLQDAEGNSHFYSYDSQGNMAKEWQWVTVADGQAVPGSKLYAGEVYRYDAIGQKTETIVISETMNTSITAGIHNRNYALANKQVTYNAFGEVVSLGLNGGAQEYFEYDNAGRIWRSNSGDGVDRIHLYDVQGNTVQSFSSQGRDLSQAAYDYSQLSATAALSSDIQKSSFFYDKLGRLVRQMEPGRTQGAISFNPESAIEMDRWGNITRYVDAAGMVSEFTYDRFNNRIQQVQAVGVGVQVVGENGGVQNGVTPTSYGYYDLYGRMVGSTDANGNERVMEYDEAGQLTRELAADGGIKRHYYNNFGFNVEEVMYAGAEGSTPLAVLKVYDRNGRLLNEYLPNGGETAFTYDEAGNRTSVKRLASIAGNGNRRYEVTLYSYDSRGNLIEEKLNARIEVYAANGNVVSISDNPEPVIRRYRYDLQNNKITEQRYLDTALLRQINASWQYNYFGRLTDHVDFGGGDYGYSYNSAGQLTQESVSRGTASASKSYNYYQDGLLHSVTRDGIVDRYEYDIQGRLIDEYSNNGGMYHNHYEYDALSRLTRMTGNGGNSLTFTGSYGSIGRGYYVDMNYAYDAVGNRRRVHGVEGMNPGYSYIIGGGPGAPPSVTVDGNTGLESVNQWYTYDAESRVLISRGKLQGGQIVLDSGSQIGADWEDAHGSMRFTYDKTGKRIQAQYYRNNSLVTENHYYDAVGNVVATTENGVGQYTSERSYDLLGRMKTFTAYSSPGTKSEIRQSTYNTNGQLARMRVYNVNGSGQQGSLQVDVRYNYVDSYDSDGNLKHYTSQYSSGGGTSDYTYNHDFYESAVASTITGTNRGANTTTHNYDAFGNLLSVSNSNSDMRKNNLGYSLNAAGRVVHKSIGYSNANYKHQFYYYANGRVIGTGGHQEVDFDYTGTPLSDAGAVSQQGSYIVRAGDTLQGIALAVYGDAQRWYLIADANGLNGDADLIEGQSLRIPGQVSGLRNSSDAFRVFGHGDIIGDTTPQVKMPSIAAPIVYDIPKKKSNAFVVILAIIVAIVVTIYVTSLAKEAWGYVAAAMVGAAAGNIAGQAILMAGGEQDGFDWGSLATDVITAGITAGIGQAAGAGEKAAKAAQDGKKAADAAEKARKVLETVGTAVIKNIFSQGVAIAMGQQEEFSWTSLATSAIMAPINAEVNSNIGETEGFEKFGERFVGGLTTGALSQGIRIMLEGGGKMDFASVAANAFGQALGNSIAGEMQRNLTIERMNQVNQSFSELQEGEAEQAYLDTSDQNQIEDFYQARKYVQQQEKGLDAKSLNEAAGVAALMFAAERRQIFDNAMKARLLAETVTVSGQKSSPLEDNGIKTKAVLDSQGVKLEPKNLPSAKGYKFKYMTSTKEKIQDMLSGKKAYNDLTGNNKTLLKYLMQLDIAIGEYKTQLDTLLALSSKITVPKFADVIKEAHAAFANTTFVYNAEPSPDNIIIAAEYRASMTSTTDPAVFISDLNPKISKKDIKRFLKNPASVSQQAKAVNMNLVQDLKFTKGTMEFYEGFEDVYKRGFSADVDGGYFLDMREGREGFRDLIAHEFGHSIVELNTVGPNPKKLLPPRITANVYNQMDPKIQKIILDHRRSVLYGRRKIEKTFREGYADVYALTHRAFELNGGKIGLTEKVYDSYFDKVTDYKWTGRKWKER